MELCQADSVYVPVPYLSFDSGEHRHTKEAETTIEEF